MSKSHVSGPLVIGPAGTAPTVSGNGLQIVSGNLQLDSGSIVSGSATLSATELGYVDGITPGTAAASKAVILGASKDIATITSATITTLTSTTVNATTVDATTLEINNVAVGSTAAEIDNQCDVSLNSETIAEGGAVSVTKRITSVVSTGAGAITLAAPSAATLGMVKVIQMTGGEHDVTLALTNVQGQSSGTTATFSDTNDTLVLVAGTNKWNVIGEAGIALS